MENPGYNRGLMKSPGRPGLALSGFPVQLLTPVKPMLAQSALDHGTRVLPSALDLVTHRPACGRPHFCHSAAWTWAAAFGWKMQKIFLTYPSLSGIHS